MKLVFMFIEEIYKWANKLKKSLKLNLLLQKFYFYIVVFVIFM